MDIFERKLIITRVAQQAWNDCIQNAEWNKEYEQNEINKAQNTPEEKDFFIENAESYHIRADAFEKIAKMIEKEYL